MHHPAGSINLKYAVAAALALASLALPAWQSANAQATSQAEEEDVADLSDVSVTEDPSRVLPTESSTSSFGFSKPLLETPRSVSFISSDVIEKIGISAVEDLTRVAPGVFTTTRFGVQGGIDVRNISADTYFRGMKRVTLQGNGRSVLAALDSIEIVKGPPSPIFGMGRIGGYVNTYPKSGRAKNGTYLLKDQGFIQAIAGSYNRSEFSGGVGGPLKIFGKQGGYYTYALLEDSKAFYRGVPVKQKVLQASNSLDNVIGPFRMESGINYQVGDTAGALTGRFNQALVDSGRYVRGTALVDLDSNHNGTIGFLELHQNSPVRGNIGSGNQPLIQYFPWQKDEAGNYRKLEDFVQVAGIPKTMYDYLVAHPEADPTGLLRAQGVGGPQPTSGQVPVGMVLDPRTTGYDTLDLHRAAAYERELRAQMMTMYVDMIYDIDPSFTAKNQLFYDELNQYKISNQPGCCLLHSKVYEDKFTITKDLTGYMPAWLRMNSLASFNVRYVEAKSGGNAGNDYGTHRSDAMADTWVDSRGGMTANTTFSTAFDNPNLYTDGNPFSVVGKSTDLQTGFGMQFDIDMFSRLNLLLGGRIDGSKATNVEYAGGFSATQGTSANPGRYQTADVRTQDWDKGVSWSASLTYSLPFNLHPYVTFANSSVALDGNNNRYSASVLLGGQGHIGEAYLKEAGLKTTLFGNKLFFSTAFYEQNRTDVSSVDPSDPSLGTDATSTRTRGWEMEIKAVPFKNASASFYTMSQTTIYNPNNGGNIMVDARTLGFKDVVDGAGNVIYPAEAFLYGGRSYIVLPAGMKEYETKQGNPPIQMGFNLDYQTPFGIGATFSGNYYSSTYSGRLKLTRLPAARVYNIGLYSNRGPWELKLDITNLFDKTWFRARTGDTLGDVLAQVMPDRKVQVTAKVKF